MNQESGQDQDARQAAGQPEEGREADGLAALQAEVDALREALEKAREEALRERADLDNQRKRMARELDSARRFANERLLGDMVPVFDSLEAGLASAAPDDPLRAGLEATLRQLQKVTAANGFVEVAPQSGDAFDPERHQAMSVAAAEGVAPGAVVQLFQKGYVLNERLLRPAMVVVAAS